MVSHEKQGSNKFSSQKQESNVEWLSFGPIFDLYTYD